MIKAIIFSALVTLSLGQCDECVDNDFLNQDMLRAPFESEDFLLKYDAPGIENAGGSIAQRAVDNTPILGAIRGGGITTVGIVLNPCGVITPHTHPGGGENVYVTGGVIKVGQVGAGRVLSSDVAAGESFQIEQGLTHFLVNEDCDETATAFAALVSGDPATVLASTGLFSGPDTVINAAFPTLSAEQVQEVKAAALEAGLLSTDPACMARCGGAAPGSGSYGRDGEWMVAASK